MLVSEHSGKELLVVLERVAVEHAVHVAPTCRQLALGKDAERLDALGNVRITQRGYGQGVGQLVNENIRKTATVVSETVEQHEVLADVESGNP